MTETAAPLITIGLTCFNAADTIGRAIAAALKQDWPNLEIVIVDDCSKDNSTDVIDAYARQDQRVRLIRHEQNTGFAGALNTLIANAQGEFIAIFDDDDESRADRLKLQHAAITAHELKTGTKLIACYGSVVKRYPNGYALHTPAIGSRPEYPVGQDMVNYHLYLDRRPEVFYGGGTPSCSLMARKSTFNQAGPYDTSLRRNEDSDFAVRLGLLGGHFIGCPEEIITQYASDGADKRPEVALASEQAFIRKYKHILDHHGRYNYACHWIKVRYYHFSNQKLKAICEVLVMGLKNPYLTFSRFIKAAPRRLSHEARMRRPQGSNP